MMYLWSILPRLARGAVFLGLASLTHGASLAAAVTTASTSLVAELDYGTFQGAYSRTYNISYWQKIPFAAPPTGPNRFRGPLPPAPLPRHVNGSAIVYDSSQRFDMCPQRTVNGSEDCLYLGLYSRPWSRGQPLRPVVVVFYGGGWIQGSASFSPPPSLLPVLNVSPTSDLVAIYPNYRTNAFGFLPGRQIADDYPNSDLNPGLLDQHAAIKWASMYAEQFGGDPDRITIQGQSAGGGGVIAQAIAQPSSSSSSPSSPLSKKPLFRAAMPNSPYWPKTYAYDSPEAQWIFDTFASKAGCGEPPSSAGSKDKDTRLACLKAASVQTLRDASLFVAASHTYTTSSYTWAPVIDGRFLRKPLSSIVAESSDSSSPRTLITPEAVYGVYNTHEGKDFVPSGDVVTTNGFDAWLAGFLPGFLPEDLDAARKLYPAKGSAEAVPSYTDGFTRAGLIYRDVVLACPAYWLAGAASKGGWLGEYSISPARHASDVYWWNTINTAQADDPLHYKGYTGAMASFLCTNDPNARKLTNSSTPGVPALRSTQSVFHITADGFANLKLTQFQERCAFWKRLAPKIPI